MRRLLLIPAIFGALTFGVLGAPAIADHGNADVASPNMLHVGNQSRGGVNSDLAFWVNIAAAGNYNGFRLLDISKPEDPVVLTTVTCRGAQGDVSFYKAKNRLLLFVSVDTPQTVPGPPPGGKDCVSADSTEALGFEGIRIWDVTDPVAPKFVKFVRTDCGSHTHTTIPDYDNQRALIYVSSYPLAATGIGPNCGQPNPEVLGRPHGKISIVEVPDTAPEAAEVLKEVSLHADTIPSVGEDGSLVGSVGCHDITAFFDANQASEGGNTKPKPQLAAAACLSEGQIWDIRDPANPRTQDPLGHSHVQNESVEIWHSAAWTWDGQVVLFGDEHGGGSAPGCGGPQDTTGNIWFYRQVPPPGPLPLLGRYALERNQLVDQPAPQECTLHNFNVIPINDNKAYIGVSSAYKGGTTVFDFSQAKTQAPFTCPLVPPADPCEFAAPIIGKEIGFYDSHSGDGQGHDDAWSTYWYNDYIYANSGLGRNTVGQNRGFDVYKLLLDANMKPCKPEQKGCTPFNARDFHHLNAQTQEGFQTLDGGGTKTGG